MTLHKKTTFCALVSCLFMSMTAHDVLLEVKGAAFVPTSTNFKDIYGTIGDFGLELTAGGLSNHLYAFSSIDFLIKNGNTVNFQSPTKVNMIDLAFGLKYFVPFHQGDFYFGVGVQPTYLFTSDGLTDPVQTSQWNCGGIAKVGVILNMPHSFFADLFIDYSFLKINSTSSSTTQTPINAAVLGVGFGYRFN